jgi:Penicillin amidase
MYANLLHATPGLTAADIPKYFKDSSFGVPAGGAERTYSPRADVTIVRDSAFGVPHIYGRTRAGAMFGLGYAGAENRLFFMDVLRHAGRGELSSFAGGANQAMDAEEWAVAPYTEADLERQADDLPKYPSGRRVSRSRPTPTTTSPASTSTSSRPAWIRRRCPASTPRSAGPRVRTSSSRPI